MRTNVLLRDLNIGVPASDGRQLEVIAQGLPCFNGAQLAIDATLRSALSTSGAPRARAVRENGAALIDARFQKEATYPELVENTRCRLVVFGVETGGRWSEEAFAFVWELARAKARGVPAYLQTSAALAWQRRWMRMIAVSTFTAFANSLIMPRAPLSNTGIIDGEAPGDLVDLFDCCGRDGTEGASRLPLRG